MLHLSPVKVSQTLGTFGTGDIQTTRGPLWVLTDGTCENTGQWDTSVFSYYGASYQEDESDRGAYPLTVQEAQFLQAEALGLPEYATEMRLGYSAWWQGKK